MLRTSSSYNLQFLKCYPIALAEGLFIPVMVLADIFNYFHYTKGLNLIEIAAGINAEKDVVATFWHGDPEFDGEYNRFLTHPVAGNFEFALTEIGGGKTISNATIIRKTLSGLPKLFAVIRLECCFSHDDEVPEVIKELDLGDDSVLKHFHLYVDLIEVDHEMMPVKKARRPWICCS